MKLNSNFDTIELPLVQVPAWSQRTAESFKDLFPIREDVLSEIIDDMTVNGFDAKHPIVAWNMTVVDGHTRLKAALRTGLSKVPITLKEFSSEDEALQYAIRAQSNRRNLTDAELDKRNAVGRPEKIATNVAIAGRTSKNTANLLGISRGKVEKLRTINDHAPSEIRDAVTSGSMSIDRGYKETIKQRRQNEIAATEPLTGEELQKMKNARLEAIRISMVKMTAARFEREIQEYPEIGYSPDEKERIKQEIIMAVEKYIDSLPNQIPPKPTTGIPTARKTSDSKPNRSTRTRFLFDRFNKPTGV